MPRDIILAVDGGQTSTKAIVATSTGIILGAGTGSPCDHFHGPHGYARNRDAIHSAATTALRTANRSAGDIVAAGLGLTSAPRESDAGPQVAAIVAELCSPDVLWVDADYVSNLAGASLGKPGVVVIAGGGSIGYGTDRHGSEALAGGLGYLMGDDGSGWFIGLSAVQAAARGSDRRGMPTALLPAVLEHFGIPSIREIMRILYDASFTRDRVSRIAPIVADCAMSGDRVAMEIMTTAGARLGEIALGAIRQLDPSDETVSVYPTGGVFAAGPILTEPFQVTITTGWPTARIRQPRFPPVVGALIHAFRELGEPWTDTHTMNVEHTLGQPRSAD